MWSIPCSGISQMEWKFHIKFAQQYSSIWPYFRLSLITSSYQREFSVIGWQAVPIGFIWCPTAFFFSFNVSLPQDAFFYRAWPWACFPKICQDDFRYRLCFCLLNSSICESHPLYNPSISVYSKKQTLNLKPMEDLNKNVWVSRYVKAIHYITHRLVCIVKNKLRI